MAGREGGGRLALPQRWLRTIPASGYRGLRLARGEGAYVWDDEGHRYLDMVSGGGVSVLGHSHPRFIAGIEEQLRRITSADQGFDDDAREDFVEALSLFTPSELTSVTLSSSGSEAVDVALQAAFAATGRARVVAMTGGYHGRTLLSGLRRAHDKSARLPAVIDIERVAFNDRIAATRAVDERVAAVIVEPVQWSGGVRVAADGYLAALLQACRGAGALLVVDEVQTALRTWPPLLSLRHGVVPDAVCLGPSIANGLSLGATLLRDSLAGSVERAAGAGTSAGNPVTCAAAAATLRTLAEPAGRLRLADAGTRLQERLRALRIADIKEVRGEGTMAAVEMRADAAAIMHALGKLGVLADQGRAGEIRVLPPSVIEGRQIDHAVEMLATAIRETRNARRARREQDEPGVELRGVAARDAAHPRPTS